MSKVVMITGAGRGMGVDVARAALEAGHQVVATARTPENVEKALAGADSDRLLTVALDITSPQSAEDAVDAALARFGRIDVLINNAAASQLGYFEEVSQESVERQVATNLFGPMNVTRAVLPSMRQRRTGLVVAISSIAGLVGQEFTAAYAASKFGLEGWMESLAFDLAPFKVRTLIVEPGFFRTELLGDASVSYGDTPIEDYAERTQQTRAWWESMNGAQGGDPAKFGRALMTVISGDTPPQRWVAGADAVGLAEQKATDLQAQIDAYRDLSTRLGVDDEEPVGSPAGA